MFAGYNWRNNKTNEDLTMSSYDKLKLSVERNRFYFRNHYKTSFNYRNIPTYTQTETLKKDYVNEEKKITFSMNDDDELPSQESGLELLRKKGIYEKKIEKILKEYPNIWDYININ